MGGCALSIREILNAFTWDCCGMKYEILWTYIRTSWGRFCETYKQTCQLDFRRTMNTGANHYKKQMNLERLWFYAIYLLLCYTHVRWLLLRSYEWTTWPNCRKIYYTKHIFKHIYQAYIFTMQNMDLDYLDGIFSRALIDIKDKIILLGGSNIISFGLPHPNLSSDSVLPS